MKMDRVSSELLILEQLVELIFHQDYFVHYQYVMIEMWEMMNLNDDLYESLDAIWEN